MKTSYTKMHGTGNLILVVDQRRENRSPPAVEKLRELSDEHSGPGFDQLMWIGPSTNDETIASYQVFNADGSEVEQCGNGVRCVAKFLSDSDNLDPEFVLQSPAGPISARIFADGQVAVSMGTPIFEPAKIPFVAGEEAKSYALIVGEQGYEISAVSMGNPHCVLNVDDVALARVAELGATIEHHERFPELTNVGFMCIVDRENINLRVHERGVGETAACGTGACAAMVSGQRLGLLDEEVTVHLPGGKVVVSWRGADTAAWLKGNAELIDEGLMDLQE